MINYFLINLFINFHQNLNLILPNFLQDFHQYFLKFNQYHHCYFYHFPYFLHLSYLIYTNIT